MHPKTPTTVLALALAIGSPLFAQAPSLTVDEVGCLPLDGNAPVSARVTNNVPESEVRLYFRRLNDTVEDAYYLLMQPAGGGRYRGVLPQPADFEPRRFDLKPDSGTNPDFGWAAWWRAKDGSEDRNPTRELDPQLIRERAGQGKQIRRDWMHEMEPEALQSWLERQKYEPAEVYAGLYDAQGTQLARSPTRVATVTQDCRVALDAEELGMASNLEIGETAGWQEGDEPFHWNCEGIISRRDPRGVKRGDETCRACVVAWWKLPGVVLPAAAAVAGGIIITRDDPPPASPSVP